MFKRMELTQLDEYFTPLRQRAHGGGVYFCRLCDYADEVRTSLPRYYAEARARGAVIEGKLPNPDMRQLGFYEEMMGMAFRLDPAFFQKSLQKWMPRLQERQRGYVVSGIMETLQGLRDAGKNENMLKNTYIKFMCWFYYKFEQVASHLGEDQVPKILYEGSVSQYELLFFSVLSAAGADLLLLQYAGDEAYLKLDPQSQRSSRYTPKGASAFPEGYSLARVRQAEADTARRQQLYGPAADQSPCTNAWLTGKLFDDLQRDGRGDDPALYYNAYVRLIGVEDKTTYLQDLYQLQQKLRAANRPLVIVENPLPPPTPEETAKIPRHTYKNIEQLMLGLRGSLRVFHQEPLQRIAQRAFVDTAFEAYAAIQAAGAQQNALQKLESRLIYVLCYLRRYADALFARWQSGVYPAFFAMGPCQNDRDALWYSFLSRLPCDVVLFEPDTSVTCTLRDDRLYDIHQPLSMAVKQYPTDTARLGTVAYEAEQELNTLLYQDTGLYRNQQFAKGQAIALHTTYEEIAILWDQELKFRPNFSTHDDTVNLPVLFAKVSGVKDGAVNPYWLSIKKLLTPDTRLIARVPHVSPTDPNPMKAYATDFFAGGRVQKARIKNHKAYRYGFLREAMQDFLLDRLQLLIDQRLIKGTFQNGTEYTIVAEALNLDMEILRALHQFDFTLKNPKLIFLLTGEDALSLQDTIQVSLLHLLGFDILFFVPTGYLNVEQHLAQPILDDHQIGPYLYDLQPPDFNRLAAPSSTLSVLRDFFKRK